MLSLGSSYGTQIKEQFGRTPYILMAGLKRPSCALRDGRQPDILLIEESEVQVLQQVYQYSSKAWPATLGRVERLCEQTHDPILLVHISDSILPSVKRTPELLSTQTVTPLST